MHSFYDPNTTATLDSFQASLDWAAEGKFSQRDLDEAKLEVFAGVDAPVTPAMLGSAPWNGVSDEQRQRQRTRLLDTDIEAVVAVAQDLCASEPLYNTIVGSTTTEEFKTNDQWDYEVLSKQ